jgi:LPXTG-motif cell wall-anchored protein
LVVFAMVAGWTLVAQPASADSVVPIQPGSVPVTALAFAQIRRAPACDRGNGPFAAADVWTFTTKPNRRDLLAVTVTFTEPGSAEPQTRIIASADGAADAYTNTHTHAGGIDYGVAWVVAPAGWTLVGASARVAGDASAELVLRGTCPGARVAEPAKEAKVAPIRTVDGSATSREAVAGTVATDTPTTTGGMSTSAGRPLAATPHSPASLPSTGLDIAGMVTLGSALVIAGVLLLIVRRRREPRSVAEPPDEPLFWVRPYP